MLEHLLWAKKTRAHRIFFIIKPFDCCVGGGKGIKKKKTQGTILNKKKKIEQRKCKNKILNVEKMYGII